MASRVYTWTGITATLGSVLLLLFGGAAFAQDAGNYPSRPITMIVPFAPGGASDFVARMIQQGISEILGQQIVVDNRPGAAGMIGTESAARAVPGRLHRLSRQYRYRLDQSRRLRGQHAHQAGQGSDPRHDLRRNAKHPDHPDGLPRQQRQRADRLCEGESGSTGCTPRS
jgi:hypothetical protein